jgi:3-hydroxyisobutyrate dehydrogenase
MHIGMVGLGKMGTAMAERLMENGHTLTVWNRTAAKADKLVAAGATLAASPFAVAQAVDVIIVIMFDGPALQAVFHGADTILAADLTSKLVIEMSTVRPEIEQELAAAVALRGGAFIECPVGGTVGPARAGKLIGLVGGSVPDYERAKPLLTGLCRRVEHVGPVGAGAAMKLAINLPLAVFWQALGEAASLVRHLGRDPAWLVELFADSSGGANALKVRGPAVADALGGGDGGASNFALDSIRKDLRTMLEEARSQGFDLPVTAQALTAYDQASRAGMGQRDAAWMPAFWASKADAPAMPTRLTLERATIICESVLRRGRELELAPLTVAVLDAGGHLVAFQREDNSGIMRYDIAFGKAYGSLGMGFGSREFLARAQGNPSFVGALAVASGGRMIPVPGGVLVKTEDGEIVGAVGVSGDTSDQDEVCVLAGIAAAGFVAQVAA